MGPGEREPDSKGGKVVGVMLRTKLHAFLPLKATCRSRCRERVSETEEKKGGDRARFFHTHTLSLSEGTPACLTISACTFTTRAKVKAKGHAEKSKRQARKNGCGTYC